MKYRNFVIVGTQRTGSSALADMLTEHPQVACGWEWTERAPWLKKIRIMEAALGGDFSQLPTAERQHVESSLNDETRVLGFRRLFGSSNKWFGHPRFSLKLFADRFEQHLDWLKRHPAVAVIHIVRSNDLAWLKSKYLAQASGLFVGSSYPERMTVRVPVDEALARLRSKAWIDDRLGSLASTNPYGRILYEAFADDPHDAVRQALGLLDLEPQSPQEGRSRIRAQSTRPDAEYLANYEELVQALLENGFVATSAV